MTKIKFCGLRRTEDIEAANEIKPDYIGFVFAKKSKRFIEPDDARELKKLLSPDIKAVGVFVDEEPEKIASVVNAGITDIVQLHGKEDEEYIGRLRKLIHCDIIKAFVIKDEADTVAANKSSADFILLDSGAGTGKTFNWDMISQIGRPYFLAGGISAENMAQAIEKLHPYALDISSGIETNGVKDKAKMAETAKILRSANPNGDKS